MILLLSWLSCAEAPYDPVAECHAEGRACCGDSECGQDELCHFVYTCVSRGGVLDCEQPIGDRECHELCLGTDAFVCQDPTQTCQQIEFVQGSDSVGSETACF